MVTAAGIALVTSALASAQTDPNAATEGTETTHPPAQTGYAPVNGLEMYYEIHGSGQPLVLIHGGLGGIPEFAQLLPLLAETRQVIAVELQAHGHTADIDRPLSFEFLADDVAALIEHLGFENADVLGFSLGGGVALQTAIRHPEVVRRLVLISTPYSRANIHPEFLAGMSAMNAEAAAAMLETPMYQLYSSAAPNLEDWPTLVDKAAELLRQDYDWSTDIDAITAPTLIVLGDSDQLPPASAVEMFGLLGGGVAGGMVAEQPSAQLAVLPNTNHFSILSRIDLLLPVITPFLDAPLPEAG
jgi:pimeloyl-ACP methyl ester carboxylesterase